MIIDNYDDVQERIQSFKTDSMYKDYFKILSR